MFKEIIKAFQHKDEVREMTVHVVEMLDAGHWMFDQACSVLMRKTEWDDLHDPLYERDAQINEAERAIRERIVTHLSVGNNADLAPCLILMNIVKDAERIGDYCKNIFEVGKFFKGTFSHRSYAEPLDDIRCKIAACFEPIKQALLNHDEAAAERILRETKGLVKQCDLIIQQLLCLTDELPPAEAVAYALLARHYKRVEAHLSNIALSIISPVSLLDFPGQLDD
jgi:phosphate transport system protein